MPSFPCPNALALKHKEKVRWSMMSKITKRLVEGADAVYSWLERIPRGKTVATVLILAPLAGAREYIMDDPWRFLAGVGVGILIGLPTWLAIAKGANARHRSRLLHGLSGRLEEFDALLTDLYAESVEPDRVKWKRIHYQIWCVGHILEKAGVKSYPNADNPDYARWEGYLATLMHYIREEEYERIQELHEIMPPPEP